MGIESDCSIHQSTSPPWALPDAAHCGSMFDPDGFKVERRAKSTWIGQKRQDSRERKRGGPGGGCNTRGANTQMYRCTVFDLTVLFNN